MIPGIQAILLIEYIQQGPADGHICLVAVLVFRPWHLYLKDEISLSMLFDSIQNPAFEQTKSVSVASGIFSLSFEDAEFSHWEDLFGWAIDSEEYSDLFVVEVDVWDKVEANVHAERRVVLVHSF